MLRAIKFLFKYETAKTTKITLMLLLSAIFESAIFMSLIPIINISLGAYDGNISNLNSIKNFFERFDLILIFSVLLILLILINLYIIYTTNLMLKYAFSLGHKYSYEILNNYLLQFIYSKEKINFSKSDILNKVTTDMERMSVYIGLSYCNFAHKTFLFIILYSVLLIFNSKITFLLTIFFLSIYCLIIFILIKKNKYYKNLMQNSSREKFYFAKIILNGVEILDIYNRINNFLIFYKKKSKDYMISRSQSEFYTYFPKNLLELISLSIILVILIYFLKLNISLSLYLPVISAYIIAGYRLIPSIQNIYANSARLQTHSNIIEEIERIINKEIKPFKEQKNKYIYFKKLEIKKLFFNYDKKIIFKNLSFSLEKGETICIVGNSGVGKSTLLKIITGFEKNFKGDILINDKINRSTNFLKNFISYIPQDPYIIKGDLAFNISLDNKNIEKDINRVNKILNDADFDLDRSFKYNKEIHEEGSNLSSGQKQRLEILRSLFFDREVLILDEPTANLDKNVEKKIINQLLGAKKTLIIITHSKELIKASNKILFLKENDQFIFSDYKNLLSDKDFQKLFQF